MFVVKNIRLPIDRPADDAFCEAARRAGLPAARAGGAFVYRRALDARRERPSFVYTIGFPGDMPAGGGPDVSPVAEYEPPAVSSCAGAGPRPVVAGFGPAGIFCAYLLARAGLRPLVLERGAAMEKRRARVDAFFSGGALDESANIQFGEGGAGTFSDGKLTTRISDPRCRFVLQTMVEAGAPEEILYLARPHLGTDKLSGVVGALRRQIEAWGGEVVFEAPVTRVEVWNGKVAGVVAGGVEKIGTDCLVLACGHSARPVFDMLASMGVSLAPKPFSVGVRIEHLQRDIDAAMYGVYAGHPLLGPAEYALSYRRGKRGVYSFCMCPGGQVVAAASEAGGVVTNGMSAFARDGANGNSALCVSVLPEDFGGDPFAGIALQRRLEQAAYAAGGGGYGAPVQRAADFLDGRRTAALGRVRPTYPRETVFSDLNDILPDFVREYLHMGLTRFGSTHAFMRDPDGLLTGVETRTSSPARIPRGEDFEAADLGGLYPCGEGAGYAGGIMSAAVDGLAVAERIIQARARKGAR